MASAEERRLWPLFAEGVTVYIAVKPHLDALRVVARELHSAEARYIAATYTIHVPFDYLHFLFWWQLADGLESRHAT